MSMNPTPCEVRLERSLHGMNDKSIRFFANAWGAHVPARNIGRPRESGKSTGANRELGAYSFLRTTEASICRSGTDQYFRSSDAVSSSAVRQKPWRAAAGGLVSYGGHITEPFRGAGA